MSNIPYLPDWIIAAYIFIIGVCIGSFLNVVILRSLSNEGFVFSRSKCPYCSNQLKWYMNIPLFSYIFLKGQCAYCKKKISLQYPLVELLTGLVFLGTFLFFGLAYKTLFLCVIFSFFIVLSGTDFKQTVIVDIHSYILYAICLVYSTLGFNELGFLQAFLGSIFAFLFFEGICLISRLIIKQRMFGFGDSLIALSIGALFGVKNTIIVILLSFIIQSLSAIPLLIKKAYLENKKKLALSYFFVFVSILSLVFIKKLPSNYYLATVLIMTVFLIYSSKNILLELNNKKDNDNFAIMPFGPAFLMAAFICVFYLVQIKKFVIEFFIY